MSSLIPPAKMACYRHAVMLMDQHDQLENDPRKDLRTFTRTVHRMKTAATPTTFASTHGYPHFPARSKSQIKSITLGEKQ